MAAFHPLPLLQGATTAAQQEGFVAELLVLSNDHAEHEGQIREFMASGLYEGLLLVTPIGLPQTVATQTQPAVLSISEFDDDMRAIGEFADARPLAAIMERLAQLGHRRFLHVAGPLEYPSAVARRDAYLVEIEKLNVESLGIIQGDWHGRSGLTAIRSLPGNTPPVAIIAANDLIATGVIRGAHERGWSIPGNISVSGWDDFEFSELQVPSITTVHLDRERLGAHSIRRLIAAVRGEVIPEPLTNLQRIIWRESTAPPA